MCKQTLDWVLLLEQIEFCYLESTVMKGKNYLAEIKSVLALPNQVFQSRKNLITNNHFSNEKRKKSLKSFI